MATDAEVLAVGSADLDRVKATLTLGFVADPVARWQYANAQDYMEFFPTFVGLFGGRAFDHGTAYQVGDFAGSALWLPPGVTPDDEQLGAFLERTSPKEIIRVFDAIFGKLAAFHPARPHWYLPLIAVDPLHRGRGLGSSILEHVTAICDRQGSAAYLESTNTSNIPLYQRHGFALLGEVRVADAPPLFPMAREPR